MEEFTAEVTLGRAGAALSFGRPAFDDSHSVAIPFRVRAAGIDGRRAIGLDARTSVELQGWGQWLEGLLAFIDDLAANWRGWAGEKAWSDDDENVGLHVTHDGVGTVTFVVEVKHGAPEVRRARAVVPCDPGALPPFADALGRMLRMAPWSFDYPAPSA